MRIHPEGMPFLIGSAILSILAYMINVNFGLAALALTFFIGYFFRDPERVSPDDQLAIISPSDGVIIDVSEDKSPIENSEEKFTRVSIFLRVWDVHVNRMPIGGSIIQKIYKRGGFAHAETEKALNYNESLTLKIKGRIEICVRQVAGMIARRIVCYAEHGDSYKAGERYGIIKFGSRVDLYIPKTCEVFVKKGQTMIGGETIIARIKE